MPITHPRASKPPSSRTRVWGALLETMIEKRDGALGGHVRGEEDEPWLTNGRTT